MSEDNNEPKCCCGCVALEKGVTFICLITIIEAVIMVSNVKDNWPYFVPKLILCILFIYNLCNSESVRGRKCLWATYLLFGILEMIMIVGFAMATNSSSKPMKTCFETVKTESAIEYMSQNKMSEEDFLKACEYSYKFYVFVFAFLIILVTVPFRAWFTFILITWEQAGKDENQEDLVY